MSGDIVERLQAFLPPGSIVPGWLVQDAINEIERLRAEFSAVLGDAIAKDAEVGAADALANTLRALVAEQHDEIERLRAAGDALYDEVPPGERDVLRQWQEARRER